MLRVLLSEHTGLTVAQAERRVDRILSDPYCQVCGKRVEPTKAVWPHERNRWRYLCGACDLQGRVDT